MEKAGDLFGNKFREQKVGRRSERGDLVDYFYEGCRRSWDEKRYGPLKQGYIRWKLAKLTKRDLYYMKSTIDDAVRRGDVFGKVFFGMLKERK